MGTPHSNFRIFCSRIVIVLHVNPIIVDILKKFNLFEQSFENKTREDLLNSQKKTYNIFKPVVRNFGRNSLDM